MTNFQSSWIIQNQADKKKYFKPIKGNTFLQSV